jgi:cytochrome c biogenesis protein CcmG/thiol:disulfide interchange protein DsbE
MDLRPLITALALAFAGGPALGHEDLTQLDLTAYRGKVVYLDFWASWCAPCRRSFPWLDGLQRQHGPEGFVVIAVNVDTDRALASGFLAEVPVGFKVAYDPQGRLAAEWRLLGMPSSFLIDRTGKVRASHQGFRKGDEAARAAEIVALLAETTR